MKRIDAIFVGALIICAGCSSTGEWAYVKMTEIPFEKSVPPAASCMDCHESQYATWKKTDHADASDMKVVPAAQLRECGACHNNLSAHIEAPEAKKPSDIKSMSKSEQNQLCGNCHYNKEVFGRDSINPNLDHGLFTSVGFSEMKEHQLSCLDCHEGHSKHGDMLQSIQAHTCFKCHDGLTYATMGIFQPFNYLADGKICTACHAPHGATKTGQAVRMIGGFGSTCIPCHI